MTLWRPAGVTAPAPHRTRLPTSGAPKRIFGPLGDFAAERPDTNTAIVRRLTEAFTAGDSETVLSLFHDDIEIREAPSLPWGGVHRGRDGFVRLQALMGSLWETSEPELRVSDAGDVVVLRERMVITGTATGASMELEVVDVITVRDGRITEIDVYYKDVHAVLEVLGR